jgi:hypothetical protein
MKSKTNFFKLKINFHFTPGRRTIRLHCRGHPGVPQPLRRRQPCLLAARELGQHDGHGGDPCLQRGSRGRGEHHRNPLEGGGQRGTQETQGEHLGSGH